METMRVTGASVTPPTVFTGAQFIISVGIEELCSWLLDSSELFVTDSAGAFILTE